MRRMFKRSLFDRIKSTFCQGPVDLEAVSQTMLASLYDYFMPMNSMDMDNWHHAIQAWGEKNKNLFPHYQRHEIIWLASVGIGATLYSMEHRLYLDDNLSKIDRVIAKCAPLAVNASETPSGGRLGLPVVKQAYDSCKLCLGSHINAAFFSCMVRFWYAEMVFSDTPPMWKMDTMNDVIRYPDLFDIINDRLIDAEVVCRKEVKYWHF